MAIPIIGKVVMVALVLWVVGGMTAVIILVINDDTTDSTTTPNPITVPQTTSDYGPDYFQVGVGIADMTGPCVEINFMGYADLGQAGAGLHTRQFSRAFIFVKGNTRVVLVTAEVISIGIAVRREVVKKLQHLYGDMYSLQNVIITGTHTHSAPGGHLVDFILDISILGFSTETYNAYVEGITRSIIRAHENMSPARLYTASTRVWHAHMNRSPYSYMYNPEEERSRYDTNTDNELTQVRIVKPDGSLHGVLNWFAVHTTSMNMTNKLVSSDNLGYAAMRLETELNPGRPVGKPAIVAGFLSASLGDVSPNTRGARCEFSGRECDNQFLLCEARELCFSMGPGEDMFQSTEIIGTRVFQAALEVLNSEAEELVGELAVVHQFVEMSEETVPKYDPVSRTFNASNPVKGCVPSLGYSFASGTIDGANLLNITQGTVNNNPLLDLITDIVARPTAEDIECHAPKPILLATGRANFPLPWHPHRVSISLIWLGNLAIAGIPGEPSTMAGRRVKDVIGSVMEDRGFERRVVVSALANEYIHYVTTFEEYQVQRYEAASVIYGPHTLDIFLNKFREFTAVAIEGGHLPPGPEPIDFRNNTISLIGPVIMDTAPFGTNFGDVLQQPPDTVAPGDVVSASFVAANPRNDLLQESSHAAVERLELGHWVTVASDADWTTKFKWKRESTILGTSTASFEWNIPLSSIPSNLPHRIVYRGTARRVTGVMRSFQGATGNFTIGYRINV
ncbi:neutral ceramidase-like [Zerene cesonia]|uniref:neutral ceramidase-like n=1 Tax=Zerene cesonia TaxID=33412 RepID=UPI0018E53896|nr:neutral ceramidase-like [Zerene cesonia]